MSYFRCGICKRIFKTKHRLNKHIKDDHSEFTYECDQYHCSKLIFASAKLLAEHRENEHKKVPCHICGQMLKPENIESHIQRTHEISRRSEFMCEICGEMLSSYSLRKYHTASMHGTHQQLQCDICKKWLVYGI